MKRWQGQQVVSSAFMYNRSTMASAVKTSPTTIRGRGMGVIDSSSMHMYQYQSVGAQHLFWRQAGNGDYGGYVPR